ncbi:hypothetical protein MSPP1_003377 [Malassezia sp. CBS 17886]|nr:hypothetical protein MSPP1_003377 [Malassezia sp. CBS 17886]
MPPPPPRGAPPSAAPVAPPSHAEFLLEQTRMNVHQLSATNALDPLLCRQLEMLLAQAAVRPPEPPGRSPAAQTLAKGSKEDVSARNRWVRDIAADTTVVPMLVDTALSVSCGPLLSSTQRKAIVQVVTRSQKRIAEAVTDPERQRAAQSYAVQSTKSAHSGIISGWKNAGDKVAQRREEANAKAQAKKQEKQEAKELEDELRREREAFAHAGGHTVPPPPSSRCSSPPPASGAVPSTDAGFPPSAPDDSARPSLVSLVPDNAASASVSCLPSEMVAPDTESHGQMGAVTTTFAPWPGLVLTCALVVSEGSAVAAGAAPEDNRSLPPPPARDSAPPPPPPAGHSMVTPPPARVHTGAPPPAHASSPAAQQPPPPPVHGHVASPPQHVPPPPSYARAAPTPGLPSYMVPGGGGYVQQGVPPGTSRDLPRRPPA